MTNRELLHAWRLSATCCAAPHTVRTWCGALLDLQLWKFSGETPIFAVFRSKPFNLFFTFLPVHSCFPCCFCKSLSAGKYYGTAWQAKRPRHRHKDRRMLSNPAMAAAAAKNIAKKSCLLPPSQPEPQESNHDD